MFLILPQLSELCDSLRLFSQPRNLETSRQHVAQALIHLLPALNERKVSTDLDLHVRYALCQAVNAAFQLLSDEDTEVRLQATDFVSRLELKDKSMFCAYPKLSTCRALQKLFIFSLQELSDCAEWLMPITELFFAAWSESSTLEDAIRRQHRHVLYEIGEGLNVYEEPAALTNLFYKTLVEKSSNIPFRLDINLTTSLEIVHKIVDLAASQVGPFSVIRTPPGYLMITRCLNFLRLLVAYPNVAYDSSGLNMDLVKMMIDKLSVHENCYRK